MQHSKASKLLAIIVGMTFSAVAAMAGQPTAQSQSCGGVHRSGDFVTCYVKFASKTNFRDLQVQFNLPREDKPRTQGIYINFILRETKRIGPRIYSVSGVVNDCVPGTYILAAIVARTARGFQQYGNLPNLEIVVGDDPGKAPPQDVKHADAAPATDTIDFGPHVVETPPSDPNVFPTMTRITNVPVAATPVVDLVSMFSHFFHRSDSCGGVHNQGDTAVCLIHFEGNPRFSTVALSFTRADMDGPNYESQLCLGFGVGTKPNHGPLPPGVFEVRDEIPRCRAGRYKIGEVTAFATSGANRSVIYVKEYINGRDFNSAIVLTLKDISHREFPAVVAVGNKMK